MGEHLIPLMETLGKLDYIEIKPGVYANLSVNEEERGNYVVFSEPESEILVVLGHPDGPHEALKERVATYSENLLFAGAGSFYLLDKRFFFRGSNDIEINYPSPEITERLNQSR